MVADFYAMLGADPGADRSALEAALARCQPRWSSGTRNPKTKHSFQSYLDQVPEIRRVLLGDPAARASYDAELASARRADREVKLDELGRLVRLRAAKGGLTDRDRAKLRDEAGKLGLTPADLDPLIAPIAPKAEAASDAEAAEPAPDVLDAVARKQIRSALELLRRRDLYDALGVARDAPGPEIGSRADAERRRWMQKAQVTAEKTAWLEVVSHAQSHLGSPEARARYDRTLAMEAEEGFNESVAFAVDGLTRLDYGTRAALIDEAGARGIVPDRAEALIGRACRRLGVARDAPALILTSIEPPRFLRCRSCSGVTDFDDASNPSNRPECRHCGAPLRWTCPVCRRVQWVDQPRCACGFPLEHVEPLVRHFEEAQRAHRARDYATALDRLALVERYAPGHAGARKGVAAVRKRMAEADAARSACELARSRRHLVAARAAVLAWARLAPPDSPEFLAARDEVDRGLRMAQALAARGRSAELDDPKGARSLFEKALAIADDLDDARAGLARCPPEPPSDLVAEFDTDRVRLRWSPPPPDGLGPVRFRVVRRRGSGVPGQINDGVAVAETAEAEAEDRGLPPGESAGYAVFTVRGAVPSRSGATAGPLAALPDVDDFRAEVRAGEVALSWTLPPGASGVRLVRNARRRPAHDRDGEPVEALPGGATDRGLDDDRVYHYAAFALYATPGGPDRASKGSTVAAVPHPPVGAVEAPTLLPTPDGRVLASWTAPPRGVVRLIRTPRPLPLAPGDRVPAATAATWEGVWIDGAAADRAEDPDPPPTGVCHYTPILAWAGGATVGHSARYSRVLDPSDLRAVRAGSGGRVHLRWRWTPQGTGSRVVARSGGPPSSADDPEAISADVSDEEYGRLGYFAINLPGDRPGPWHLAVFSVATVQGDEVFSPGLDPSARTVVPGPNPDVTVSYTLRRPSFPGRSWSLTFRTEPAGSAIPPTTLVAHPRTVPVSPDDGQIVARFPASADGETFGIVAPVDLARHRARVFADPASDPDAHPPIRFRHPETGSARA